MSKKLKVAFGLVRVSTTEQETTSQIEALRKVAKEKGYNIAEEDIFQEKISGYDKDDSKDRDSIIELRDNIMVRPPEAIFIWELSRLSRRAIKISRYIDEFSIKPRIPMYFVDYGLWTLDIKTKEPLDDNINILYGGAKSVEIERDRIKERTARGRIAKAEMGYYMGHLSDGYICEPHGKHKKIVIDKERKPVIEKIFDLYANKDYSSRQILEYLNINSIPTTNRYRQAHPSHFIGYKDTYLDRNKRILQRKETLWTDGMVCAILKDRWYIGERTYRNKIYHIDPIIDKDTWERTQSKLAQFRFAISTAKNPYLLTTKVFCGVCGRKLYGKNTGYINSYYCSSREYGSQLRCSLRSMRNENLDSIVYNIIKQRAFNDAIKDTKSPFYSMFKPKQSDIDDLKEKKKTYSQLINTANVKIKDLNIQLEYYIIKEGENIGNDTILAGYRKQIQNISEKIKSEGENIRDYQAKIDQLTKTIKNRLKLKNTLEKIQSLTDFDDRKTIAQKLIKKVVLYNPDKINTIIHIIYDNDEDDVAFYNPRQLGRKFVLFLGNRFEDKDKIWFNPKTNLIEFTGYYFILGSGMEMILNMEEIENESLTEEQKRNLLERGTPLFSMFDSETNRRRYEEQIQYLLKSGKLLEEDAEKYRLAYNTLVEQGEICANDEEGLEKWCSNRGARFYKDSMTIAEYIINKRTSTIGVFSYEDLVPLSEKGEIRKQQNKEFHKRQNKNTPSSIPYIFKDATYEEIKKKRTKLYHRIEKIKKKKRITEYERLEQIDEIRKQLEHLRYQVKYLPTNEKGKKMMEKYNNDVMLDDQK